MGRHGKRGVFMQTIDALGWQCPKPVIAAKQALEKLDKGSISILVDNEVALRNLLDFAKSQGFAASHEEEEGHYHITIEKSAAAGCEIMANEDLVIVISGNILGQGSDELGTSLMKSYLFALTEVSPKPKALIFMNAGVYLTTECTPVLESLELLDAAGVEILSCGACLNFFGLGDKLIIGQVGNMYAFAEKMNQAAKTIFI